MLDRVTATPRQTLWFPALVISVLALTIYLVTLSPTVNFVDSGEIITVGATAGIAHPPGYPFYTLLIIGASALPFGNAAVRVNMVSALCGALATALFFLLVYEVVRFHLNARMTKPVPPPSARGHAKPARSPKRSGGAPTRPQVVPRERTTADDTRDRLALGAAAGAALFLAASQTFWNWATQSKMYALHYVFVAALFWLALRARRAILASRQRDGERSIWHGPAKWLVALAATLGLAFTNHSMSYLLVPGLAILVLWPGKAENVSGRDASMFTASPWKWVWRHAPILLLAGIVPLLLYLYLPLRSSQLPLLDWGTPNNWRDFWRHVTLWEYKGYLAPQGTIGDYIGLAFNYASQQLGPFLGIIALLLALTGIWRLARENLLLLVATAITWLATFLFTYSDQAVELEAYSVPMYMMALVWAGVGLYVFLTWLAPRLDQRIEAGSSAASAQGIASPQRAAVLMLVVPLALGLAAFAWNAGRAGHRDDYTGEAYLRNHFNNFEKGALLITDNWYIVSPTYYLQQVLGERKDVTVIDKNLLRYPFYIDYIDRQYADVLAPAKEAEAKYRQQERIWYAEPDKPYPELPQLYTDFVRAIITGNLGIRPVYVEWYTPDSEASAISQGFSMHPDGLALRVDQKPYTGPLPDVQLDWKGILTDPVPKDRLAHWVQDYYVTALERMVNYARSTNNIAQADRLSALASQVRAALGVGQ